MALSIDTRNLVEQWMPRVEFLLSSAVFERNRYQVHRVFACATVLSQDEAVIGDISLFTPPFSVTQEALDWQPAQDDDLNEGDVYHHLLQMSAPRPPSMPADDFYSALFSFPSAERHFTSAQSPTFAACAQGRPASSFHRHSFRLSTLEVYNTNLYDGYHVGATALQKLDATRNSRIALEWWESLLSDSSPELIWARLGEPSAVLWQVQVDVLDMFSLNPIPSPRRRRRYGSFLQVSWGGGEGSPSSSKEDSVSEAKLFKGVRYRHDRKRFVAEMKLPKHRNKVSFGDFKSSKAAARAIDAAFYHYGIREKVNFTDTSEILSTKPPPHGLNEADKLRFVKEQARMLASMVSILPSSPSPATAPAASTDSSKSAQVPPPGNSTSIPDLGNSILSETTSSLLVCSDHGSARSTDSGVSQSAWESPMDAMPGSLVPLGRLGSTLEPFNDVAEADHSLNESCEFGELGRNIVHVVWSIENAVNVDDPSCSPSLGHFTEQCDGSELHSTCVALTSFMDSFGSVPERPACDEFQSVSVELLSTSPRGCNLFQTESPRAFQDDVADLLLQQQLISYEDPGHEQLIPHIADPSGTDDSFSM